MVEPERLHNVAVFGGTGCGKSSIINLLAGEPVADVSTGVEACTMRTRWYPISLGDRKYRLWDTMGFAKVEAKAVDSLSPYEQAHALLRGLSDGVDLILLCARKDGIDALLRNLYWLFDSFFFRGQARIALVLTHFDTADDTWWSRNKHIISQRCNIPVHSLPYVCITTVHSGASHPSSPYGQSRLALESLLQEHASTPTPLRLDLSSDAASAAAVESLNACCQLSSSDATALAEKFRPPQRPFNVILFGESGVGKSSIINLLAGFPVADVSSRIDGCTLDFRKYDITTGSHHFLVWDTVGFCGTQLGHSACGTAIENAVHLIQELHEQGGIDLLVYCKKEGRLSPSELSFFRLFNEFLCEDHVPVSFIITHLELQNPMEKWWQENGESLTRAFNMKTSAVAGHACITSAAPENLINDPWLQAKRSYSRQAIQAMLEDAISWSSASTGNWAVAFSKKLVEIVGAGQASRKRRVTTKNLMERCELSRAQAAELIRMLHNTRGQQLEDKPLATSRSHHDSPPEAGSIPEEPNTVASVPHIPDEHNRSVSIPDSISAYRQDSTFREPDFQIDDAVLNLWKQDQLPNAEASFSTAITISRKATPSHDLFAGRALVRTRLREWNTALVDAEKAIEIQPSLIGYIAKGIACVGKGERDRGLRTCDIALARFHPSHVSFLLLMKAIIVFMSGEFPDGISRIDDLIATTPMNPICYIIQAYMYLLIGISQLESSDHEAALQSFERARAQMRHDTSRPLFVISLIFGWKFDRLDSMIQQQLCEALYTADRIKDAVECFHQMTDEVEANDDGEQRSWSRDFCQRSSEKLVHLGDVALDANRYEVAISHYSSALTVSSSPQGILIKRSKAFIATDSWKQALDDANHVISLDPSVPWGYEMKHAALHKARQYDDAVHAFEMMLSKIAQSPDPDVQQHGDQYISPSTTRATIRKIVQRTLRRLPRVLINTTTGRLLDKAEQVSAFEALPIFNELVSSTTTRINYVRIKREVRQYFRYVMFSHKWEDDEPLFQLVARAAVYGLEESPTHNKLKTFCTIVRDGGFIWAWSDTCCINKSDHFILQEALVAMFKWYQGSALTIIFLRGVRSFAQLGALMKSIWNTRAWTLQEYIASKVIHFYTEDWTLYLNLQLTNHKESPEIISEMEQAAGVSAQQLTALRPGLTNIREKLRLASMRQTTFVEDAAYSLLGIFSVTGLPAIYGEGDGSLGRLLAHILTGSGDASILAWTGESGSFNSCLPAHINVFNKPATTHLPTPLSEDEMEKITSEYPSSFDLDAALGLYDRLSEPRAPWFAASRMQLPCIAFQLPSLSSYRTRSGRIHLVETPPFGAVEIRTRHDLSRIKPLYLIHPWLDALLEPEGFHGHPFVQDDAASWLRDDEEFDEELVNESSSVLEPETLSHPAPVHAPPVISLDRETRARRFVARLRQPFGALLVTPTAAGRRATPDYRRVAADSLIRVRFQENLPLTDILDNVRSFDVL